MFKNTAAPLSMILEEILKYTSINSELIPSLHDGITLQEIESKLNSFPFQIPREVEALYQWHNGTDLEIEFFNGYAFLPLDEALKIRNEWIKCNTDYIVYPPELLPLFEFEGEYYCVECSHDKQDCGVIWNVYHDSSREYNSLKTMLLAILECYEVGAYQPTVKYYYPDNPEWSYIDTIINEQQVAEIKLKYNPVRKEYFDKLKCTRNHFYYYP